jgi:hypothetical protein
VIATTIPISTNTTIATCIQIHVGGIAAQRTYQPSRRPRRGVRPDRAVGRSSATGAPLRTTP